MKELLLQGLAIAYASVGLISLVAYWPTIKDLYFHKKASANISSYVLWSGTSLVTFLYSIFVLPDLLFIFVSGTGLGACLIVLILSVGLKNRS